MPQIGWYDCCLPLPWNLESYKLLLQIATETCQNGNNKCPTIYKIRYCKTLVFLLFGIEIFYEIELKKHIQKYFLNNVKIIWTAYGFPTLVNRQLLFNMVSVSIVVHINFWPITEIFFFLILPSTKNTLKRVSN